MSKPQRKRKPMDGTKVAATRETRVMLYGSRSSTEVQESIRKIEISGRKVELQSEL